MFQYGEGSGVISAVAQIQSLAWGFHILWAWPGKKKKKATERPELLPRNFSTEAKNARSHLTGARAFSDAPIHTISAIDLRTAQHVPASLASRMNAQSIQDREDCAPDSPNLCGP